MPAETLALVIGAFDACGVEHMLAGSFASSLHGLPRTTNDIDLVINSTIAEMRCACARLDRSRFLIDDHDLERALHQRDMSNILDLSTGWKLDLIVLKERPFSASEFGRRVRSEVSGVEMWVATPEDTMLAKLEWARKGGSDRQIADASNVIRARADNLDWAYIERWAADLGVGDLLRRAVSESQHPDVARLFAWLDGRTPVDTGMPKWLLDQRRADAATEVDPVDD